MKKFLLNSLKWIEQEKTTPGTGNILSDATRKQGMEYNTWKPGHLL